ncbi:hypothetical protein PV779_54160 [Streptomyces sp. ID01-9D]|nr:hypothetical protein [Streptomyces sp. ID01-9D]
MIRAVRAGAAVRSVPAVRARKLTPDSFRHRPARAAPRRGSARDEGRSAAAASRAVAGVASSSRGTLRPFLFPVCTDPVPLHPYTYVHPGTSTHINAYPQDRRST